MKRRGFLATIGLGGIGALAGSITGRTSTAATADDAGYAKTQDGSTRVVWSVATNSKVLALTFDDGPNPLFTERILTILRNRGVTATFFAVGANVQRHPDLARAVVMAGHEIGNHTQNHRNLIEHSPAVVADEVTRGSRTIETVTGVTPKWFRAPRGRISGAALATAASEHLDVAMWSTNRGGASVADADDAAVAAHLISTIRPGAIIDLHDGMNASDEGRPSLRVRRDAEVRALDRFIAAALEQGYRFVTMTELVNPVAPDSSGSRAEPSPS